MTTEVQLVTDDIELVAIVGAHLTPHAVVRLVGLAEAGLANDNEPAPVVLVDVRRQITASAVRRARMRHPLSVFVAIVGPMQGPRELYVEGAAAVVPAHGPAIAACCSTLIELRRP